MKKLQLEFQSNVDQCGLHTFKQIQRCAGAAIYQRIRKDGTVHSYEAFKIKIVKAGSPLPNGTVVTEDYEQYPGKSLFGKTAYSCKDLANAERRYDELLKSQDVEDDEDATAGVVAAKVDINTTSDSVTVKGKRGRKAKDRSNLKIPKDKFTMKQLELMNSDFSFAFLYQHVRALLNIEFKIVETLSGNRGKPTVVYAPIDYPI